MSVAKDVSDARLALMESITRRRSVSARYNGAELRLAPHLIFQRHGDLFVSALNLCKAWRSDQEPSLGLYKLAGLREARVLDDAFDPLPAFNGHPPRPEDKTILAI